MPQVIFLTLNPDAGLRSANANTLTSLGDTLFDPPSHGRSRQVPNLHRPPRKFFSNNDTRHRRVAFRWWVENRAKLRSAHARHTLRMPRRRASMLSKVLAAEGRHEFAQRFVARGYARTGAAGSPKTSAIRSHPDSGRPPPPSKPDSIGIVLNVS
jgi:hypothetical protein